MTSPTKTVVKQLRLVLDAGQADYIKMINAALTKANAEFERAKELHTATTNQVEGIKTGVRFEVLRQANVSITDVQTIIPIGENEFEVMYLAIPDVQKEVETIVETTPAETPKESILDTPEVIISEEMRAAAKEAVKEATKVATK